MKGCGAIRHPTGGRQPTGSGGKTPGTSGRVNSPPQGQKPGTKVTIPGKKPGESTERTYGPDGRAAKDIDRGHDHGAGDPHAHDWDWSKNPPRQPGRPLTPQEKQALAKTAVVGGLSIWTILEYGAAAAAVP